MPSSARLSWMNDQSLLGYELLSIKSNRRTVALNAFRLHPSPNPEKTIWRQIYFHDAVLTRVNIECGSKLGMILGVAPNTPDSNTDIQSVALMFDGGSVAIDFADACATEYSNPLLIRF